MVIMEKINEVFFSEHGLTSTSASHLADLAQEVIAGNETKLKNMRMCQNDASSFRYIIIVLPFFIEYDLCFSYVHAFWGYNVL